MATMPDVAWLVDWRYMFRESLEFKWNEKIMARELTISDNANTVTLDPFLQHTADFYGVYSEHAMVTGTHQWEFELQSSSAAHAAFVYFGIAQAGEPISRTDVLMGGWLWLPCAAFNVLWHNAQLPCPSTLTVTAQTCRIGCVYDADAQNLDFYLDGQLAVSSAFGKITPDPKRGPVYPVAALVYPGDRVTIGPLLSVRTEVHTKTN
eukprot:TRINITY_DN10017_c0_g1_i1.p1 TRINITY_DN10017_c0_g1~~TRINITY_DN10017_c0_g1_i1.p1  ORF type:complete len:207 (-),score=26.92 TRINITY_DN10017_c0_g1_i1:375-995(-)